MDAYLTTENGVDQAGTHMDQTFASLNRNIDTGFANKLVNNLATAQGYNVKLVAYEAGQGLDQNGTNSALDSQARLIPACTTCTSG